MARRSFATIAIILLISACAAPRKPVDAGSRCAQCGVIQSINSRSIEARNRAGGAQALTTYELMVQMDGGGWRQVRVANAEGLREGDRVEIEPRRVTLL